MYSNAFNWKPFVGRKITEKKSCVRHPPSYLVGLLTQHREQSFFQACLSTAAVGSSHSAPFSSSAYTNSSVVSHLLLVNLQSLTLNQMWQSESISLLSQVCQSTIILIYLCMSKFLNKYLAPRLPPTSTPLSPVQAFVLDLVSLRK